MIVLVDTSVWVEYFQKKPLIDPAHVDLLIEERRVATCLPIKAEILSGEMSAQAKSVVLAAFDAMTFIDSDWDSHETWEEITDLATETRRKKRGVPGMIDRMILLAAKRSAAQLWTLDKKLQKLADLSGVNLFSLG